MASETNGKAGRPPREGVSALGHIHIRTTMARKSAYVRAAKPGKLTDWIVEQLDRAAGYTPDEQRAPSNP